MNLEGVIGFKPIERFWEKTQVAGNSINCENGYISVQTTGSQTALTDVWVGIENKESEVEFLGGSPTQNLTSLSSFINSNNAERYVSLGAWYSVTNKQLFISRDLFGMIPCFFVHIPGHFIAFSTSLARLISLPIVKNYLEINPARVATFATFRADQQADYDEDTFFRSVKSVLPGHLLSVNHSQVQQKPYVQFDIDKWKGTYNGDYDGIFKELLRKSVKRNTVNASVLGAHLSGGLDSSSISSLVKEMHPEQPLHTFYYSTRYFTGDDHEYARAMANFIGSIHHEVRQEDNGLVLIEKYTAICGHPQPSFIPPTLPGALMQLAHNLGCEVLLNGSDGDSIVGSGLELMEKAFVEKNWPLLEDLLQRRISAFSLADNYKDWEKLSLKQKEKIVTQNFIYNRLSPLLRIKGVAEAYRTYKSVAEYFDVSVSYLAQRSAKGILRKLKKQSIQPAALFNKDFKQSLNANSSNRLLTKSLSGNLHLRYNKEFEDVFNRHAIFLNEESFALANYYGFRNASPYYDKDLFELCLLIPPIVKFGDGRGRAHFRSAMKGILPEFVRNRRQKATVGSYGRNATIQLYDDARDLLNDSKEIWDYIDAKALNETVRFLKRDGLPMHEYNRSMFHVTRTVSLACWLNWVESIR